MNSAICSNLQQLSATSFILFLYYVLFYFILFNILFLLYLCFNLRAEISSFLNLFCWLMQCTIILVRYLVFDLQVVVFQSTTKSSRSRLKQEEQNWEREKKKGCTGNNLFWKFGIVIYLFFFSFFFCLGYCFRCYFSHSDCVYLQLMILLLSLLLFYVCFYLAKNKVVNYLFGFIIINALACYQLCNLRFLLTREINLNRCQKGSLFRVLIPSPPPPPSPFHLSCSSYPHT